MNTKIINTYQEGHHVHNLNYVMVELHIIVSFEVKQSRKVPWKNYGHIETLAQLMR